MKKKASLNPSKPLKIKMLPARFERTTYRLGGGRSILLSYGSMLILDFGFRIADCQIFTNRI